MLAVDLFGFDVMASAVIIASALLIFIIELIIFSKASSPFLRIFPIILFLVVAVVFYLMTRVVSDWETITFVLFSAASAALVAISILANIVSLFFRRH